MRNTDIYDSEPVSYCSRCYSLQVGYVEGVENSDFCLSCGCTEIERTDIRQWERLYESRYGHKYVRRRCDPERARIDSLTWEELKRLFCSQGRYEGIIWQMYPRLTRKLPKADTCLLFLDKVMRDNRIAEFRDWMYIRGKEPGHITNQTQNNHGEQKQERADGEGCGAAEAHL